MLRRAAQGTVTCKATTVMDESFLSLLLRKKVLVYLWYVLDVQVLYVQVVRWPGQQCDDKHDSIQHRIMTVRSTIRSLDRQPGYLYVGWQLPPDSSRPLPNHTNKHYTRPKNSKKKRKKSYRQMTAAPSPPPSNQSKS